MGIKSKAKKILTSDGWMLGVRPLSSVDMTAREMAERAKVNATNKVTARNLKMMAGAKKGIMTEEEYELRKKNAEKRSLEANPKVKKFKIK